MAKWTLIYPNVNVEDAQTLVRAKLCRLCATFCVFIKKFLKMFTNLYKNFPKFTKKNAQNVFNLIFVRAWKPTFKSLAKWIPTVDLKKKTPWTTLPRSSFLFSFSRDNGKGVGTNFSTFLNIGDTFGPQAFLGVVLYIKILNILEKFQNWIFCPPTRGLKKRTPPLYGEKFKSS